MGLASAWPDRIGARIGFDEGLAHLVEGGADIFLMPSRFEPCGLTQMYALHYGSAPIVRATGGLRDTVTEFDPVKGTGDGFVFEKFAADDMVAALRRMVATYKQPAAWKRLMANAFAADFSWETAARNYVAWFEKLRKASGLG
jgi:starch synthase